jgi:hypothetical protein
MLIYQRVTSFICQPPEADTKKILLLFGGHILFQAQHVQEELGKNETPGIPTP